MAKIVVVDDSRDNADLLGELLKLIGHSVRVAYDGSIALSEIARSNPDAVVLDLNMPIMDGFEVARRIRRQYGNGIRLLAHTALPRRAVAERASDAGFDSFLRKPASPIDLALAVQGRGAGVKLRSAKRDRRRAERSGAPRRRR